MWDWSIVSVIWGCLAIAAVLGGIIGWILKSLSCKTKCDALYADLSAKDEELARLRASLSKVKGDASAENTKDDGEIAALKAQISSLEGNLSASADFKSKNASLEADLKACQSRSASLEADLKISQDRQSSMEGEIKSFASLGGTAAVASGVTAAAMSGGNDAEVAKLKAEIDALKEQLEETEGEKTYLMARMKSAEAGEVRKVVPMDQRDDLELIHGVGPVIEGMLYDEGIYFFKDVAGWDDAKIAEISAKLPQFKNRIRRENWVESAKEEHFKKYGEKL